MAAPCENNKGVLAIIGPRSIAGFVQLANRSSIHSRVVVPQQLVRKKIRSIN